MKKLYFEIKIKWVCQKYFLLSLCHAELANAERCFEESAGSTGVQHLVSGGSESFVALRMTKRVITFDTPSHTLCFFLYALRE